MQILIIHIIMFCKNIWYTL